MQGTPINRLDRVWSDAPPNDGDLRTNIQNKARSWESDLERILGNHPQVALATAAVAGVLLAWMIKRR